MQKPTLQQATQLVKLARASISGDELPKTSYEAECGVFVTLQKNGNLRGCIGFTRAEEVRGLVIEAAKSAAFHDPRFPPVEKNELSKITVEISLLTKPEPYTLKSIRKGDGVVMKQGLREALFLPQVWEQLPDKKDFLRALAMKAGIWDYKTAVFKKFSVTAFKEEKPGGEVVFDS
jgi:AmmeMemoRadiSam system protein A